MKRRPEPTGAPRLWRYLGFVLPQSIREGVYEPAYLDLWRAHVLGLGTEAQPTSGTRVLSGITVAGYLLAALWYAFPRYFREGGRTKLAGRLAGAGLAIMALVLFLMLMPWFMALAEMSLG